MRKQSRVDGESKTSRTVYLQQRYTIDISTVEIVQTEDYTDEIVRENQTLLSYNMERVLGGNTQNKLCYSGQRCHRIPEALIKLYGAKVLALDLSYNELVTLRGLEGFANLRELILDNNQLGDGISFPYLPHLHTLSLNKNKIEDLEVLLKKISKNLPRITYFSLLWNKACPNQLSDMNNDEQDYQRYRYYVLYHLPKLKFLDSNRVSDTERQEARRSGQLMKVVKPKAAMTAEEFLIAPNPSPYSPLPRVIRNPNDHKGIYGKCKYKYSGKNSEGNRFILNNDL